MSETGAGAMALRRAVLEALHDDRPDLAALTTLAAVVGAERAAALFADLAAVTDGAPASVRPEPARAVAVRLEPRLFDQAGAELRLLMQTDDAPPATARPVTGEIDAALCVRVLRGALAADGDDDAAASALGALDRLDRTPSPPAHATLDELTGALAASLLVRFRESVRPIAYPPFGSPALFRAAAVLPPGGLGRHLRCVARLVMSGESLVGLVLRAGGSADMTRAALWVARLAALLPPEAMRHVVDDLADIGFVSPLGSLVRIVGGADGCDAVVWAIRDAGLDRGDLALARAAQEVAARRNPDRAIEWIVLGEVLASARAWDDAIRAYRRGLAIEPGSEHGRARLAAAQASDATFDLRGGFGTPHGRYRRRIAG